MEIKVSGFRSEELQLIVTFEPKNGNTIILGQKPGGVKIPSSSEKRELGKIPGIFYLTFLAKRRPWIAEVEVIHTKSGKSAAYGRYANYHDTDTRTQVLDSNTMRLEVTIVAEEG